MQPSPTVSTELSRAALSAVALPDPSAVNGSLSWVEETSVSAGLPDYYRYDANSSATADGLAVLTALGGLGRWLKTNIATNGARPSPSAAQTVYVNKGGSDTAGDGSYGNPFLTIQRALTSITDASTSKRYEVNVGPGNYAEPFQIKPWTSVVGVPSGANGATPNGFAITEIAAPTNSCGFDSSFMSSGFSVAWYAFLAFQNAQIWDEATIPGSQPQLNFEQCAFGAGATYLSPGVSGTDNVLWKGCLSYGGVTVKGWQFFWTQEATFLGGTITIGTPAAGSAENTTFLAQDSSIGAALSPTNVTIQTPAGAPHAARGDLSNSSIVGTLTLDGTATTFAGTVEGIPATVILLNGAPGPVRKTLANAMGYSPAVAGNWSGTAPTSVADALDRIAAKIAPIP